MIHSLIQDSSSLFISGVQCSDKRQLHLPELQDSTWSESEEYMAVSRPAHVVPNLAHQGDFMYAHHRSEDGHYYCDWSSWGIDIEMLHGLECWSEMPVALLQNIANGCAGVFEKEQSELITSDFMRKPCVAFVSRLVCVSDEGIYFQINRSDNGPIPLAGFFHLPEVMCGIPSHIIINRDEASLPRGTGLTNIPVILSDKHVHDYLNIELSEKERFRILSEPPCRPGIYQLVQIPLCEKDILLQTDFTEVGNGRVLTW